MILTILTITINFQSPHNDYDLSFTHPYYALFYRESHNQLYFWETFKEKYSSDDSVVMAEIDCASRLMGLCHIQHIPEKLPMIALVRRTVVIPLNDIQSLNDLEAHVQKEMEYDRSRMCRIFPNEFYISPVIVYNTTKKLEDACESAIESSPNINAWKYLYVQKSNKESLSVVSNTKKFKIQKDVTNETLHDTIVDYSMAPLHATSITEAERSKRRVVYFVIDTLDAIIPYERAATLAMEHTLTARMSSDEFNQIFGEIRELSTEELPSLLLFSQGMKKWMIIPNFDKERLNISKVFQDHVSGDYDSQMFFDTIKKEPGLDPKVVFNTIILVFSVIIILSIIIVLIKNLICKGYQDTKLE